MRYLACCALGLFFACIGTLFAASAADLRGGPEVRPAVQEPVEPPVLELPRNPALSPDGSRVAFSHQGDLWVAPVETGRAVRLTANDAYDGRPCWSPDGQWLAFASRRHGNFDLFVMPAVGGTPERITWHSGNDSPWGWIDAERVLMTAVRDRNYARRATGAWVAYRDGRTPTILGDFAVQRPAVSPDGGRICYERGHGDPRRRGYRGPASSELWIFDTASGEHRQLTRFEGNDLNPMWSGNGRVVYFLSDRKCRQNASGRELGLWRVAVGGGEPELVYHPGDRSLREARIARNAPWVVAEVGAGLVRIELQQGRARPLVVRGSFDPIEPLEYDRTVSGGASDLAVSPDGESVAFEAGGDIYVLRKHDEIERCARVTTAAAPDYNPVWVEDGKALLFVSERDGNGEIYRLSASAPAEAEQDGRGESDDAGDDDSEDDDDSNDGDSEDSDNQDSDSDSDSDDDSDDTTPFYASIEFFEERLTETPEDETSLQLSPDGETLAWVVYPGRLVIGDPDTLEVRRILTDGFDTPDYDWAPDSAWIAYSKVDDDYNSEVYLVRTEVQEGEEGPGVTPFNLTRHPDDDTGPRWSPDGRKLAFTSRRQMVEETDVWVAWLQKEDVEMTERERLEREEKLKKAKQKQKQKQKKRKSKSKAGGADGDAPAGEDDGVSGGWSGTISGEMFGGEVPMTMDITLDPDGELSGSVSVPVGSAEIQSGSYDASTGEIELQLETQEGMQVVVSGTIQGDTLEATGEIPAMGATFEAQMERTEPRLTGGDGAEQEEGDEEDDDDSDEEEDVEPVVIDFDDIHLRLDRVTRREGNESALGFDADSEKIFFNADVGTRLVSGTEGDEGFFSIGVRGEDEEKLEGDGVGNFTRHDKTVFYTRGGKIVGRDAKPETYPFEVTFRQDRRELRAAVLDQAWRALDRIFYDPDFHGHDWSASRAKWKPLALAASTGEDFGLMMNFMLGEMNASHMGYFGGGTTEPKEADESSTGLLGVLWDESYDGPGRRVQEVLKDMPAHRELSRLEEGEVVLAVDGREYEAGDNWYELLNGRAEEEVWLRVRGTDGELREVRIRPARASRMSDALYRRWTEDNREYVEEESGGRLGYIHIQGMGTSSLLEFERDLFNAGEGKDGLLIDVRENGGGWTTDMILAMLMVRDHAITVPRGGGEGYPQGRRVFAAWTKPIVVLCNENSYSNAEIFSWSIKTLGRGPVVGKQTYGAVISTSGTGLLDGSFVRLPLRGWYVNDENKTNMELNGCPPDYPVENLPGDFVLGLDRQLDKAVEVGMGLVE